MLYHDRIDVPESIAVDKISDSMICNYWHFLEV